MTTPAFWHDGDIEALLAGVGGVAVVHGGETGQGLYDTPDSRILTGNETSLISDRKTVTVRTSAFPTLKVGNSITVDGTAAVVVDRERSGDGALTHLTIK